MIRQPVLANVIGQRYLSHKQIWTEGSDYNYRRQAHELRLFYNSPVPDEIDAVDHGPVAFAVYPFQDVIYFCFNLFGVWEACPFSLHLMPEAERTVPVECDDNRAPGATLTILLVDARTGILVAKRTVTLSPPFTRALECSIRVQAARPFPALTDYTRQIQRLMAHYKADAIANRLALVRCCAN